MENTKNISLAKRNNGDKMKENCKNCILQGYCEIIKTKKGYCYAWYPDPTLKENIDRKYYKQTKYTKL